MPNDAKSQIVGTWEIEDYTLVVVQTGEQVRPFGDDARGYIQYSAGGHVVVALFGIPPCPIKHYTLEERASFQIATIAYAGTYDVKPDGSLVHHVRAAWAPHWIGSDQIRYPEFSGDTVTIRSAPLFSPMIGNDVVATLRFRRIE